MLKSVPVLAALFAVAAVPVSAAQEKRPVPQRQVVSDSAPLKLSRLYDSFCVFSGEFMPRGGGRALFSVTPMSGGATSFSLSLFDVPWVDEEISNHGKVEVMLYFGDAEGKPFSGWKGDALVTKGRSQSGGVRHSISPNFFAGPEFEEDILKASSLRMAINKSVVVNVDLPKGGAHFAAELARCNKGANLEYVDGEAG